MLTVDVTFSTRPVLLAIAPRLILENPLMSTNKASASFGADVRTVSKGKSVSKTFDLWVRGLLSLSPERRRPNSSLLHSKSPHPSRNPRPKKKRANAFADIDKKIQRMPDTPLGSRPSLVTQRSHHVNFGLWTLSWNVCDTRVQAHAPTLKRSSPKRKKVDSYKYLGVHVDNALE